MAHNKKEIDEVVEENHQHTRSFVHDTEYSHKWKIAVIVITVFLTFVIGSIFWVVKKDDMTKEDGNACKTAIIISIIIDLILLVSLTTLSALGKM